MEKMNDKARRYLIVILILLAFLLGMQIGKNVFSTTEVDVQYIKGDTITDSIPVPYPVKEVAPIDTLDVISDCILTGKYYELFPAKVSDSIITLTDTVIIINDWATERYYSEQLFDIDTIGKCSIGFSLKYNRVQNLSYEFTPVTKSITTTKSPKIPKIEVFGGIGVFTNGMMNLQVGAYLDAHYGISYMPVYDIQGKRWVHGLQTTYKF